MGADVVRAEVGRWLARVIPRRPTDRLLDVGALDVNGTLREYLTGVGEYVGVDMRPGPGVDVVLRAEQLREHFGADAFDIVVSSDTLEHMEDWRACLQAMKGVLRPGGWIGLATVPPGYPRHEYPDDFWRWTLDELAACLCDFEDVQVCGEVMAVGCKPTDWQAIDLAECTCHGLE